MMELPNSPWGHILTDLFGMLLSKEYVLVVQCLYSCSPVLEIVTSTSASSIISAMEIIKMNIGIPNKVGTDNGPPFNNQDFANFTKHMGFQYTRVPSYASWANGTLESFIRNLGKVLKTSHIHDHNWKAVLQHFLCSYRATPHCTTGYLPAQLLLNNRKYKIRLPNSKINTNLFRHKEVQENYQRHKRQTRKQCVKTASLQT